MNIKCPHPNEVCIYRNRKCYACICCKRDWLNSTADYVKQNSNHGTQADLCKADNIESEEQ